MVTGGAARTRVRLGRGFHLLFAASAVSTLGDGFGLTALPLLAAQLSRDPLPVSLVSSAGHLPWLMFGLIAGAITDRHDRRRLMWGTDVFRAALVAGLAAAVLTGTVTIWALVMFAFLLGSAGTLFDSAAHPGPVPPRRGPARRLRPRGLAPRHRRSDPGRPPGDRSSASTADLTCTYLITNSIDVGARRAA